MVRFQGLTGQAGCYSDDWIDNDFKPGADRILPEHEQLRPGDKIRPTPDTMGDPIEDPEVAESPVFAGDSEGGRYWNR